jgi:antitoxin PrlF
MDVSARMSSKGRVTVPKSVRDALDLHEGDHLTFRVEGARAVIARTPDLLDLAGAVSVTREGAGAQWEEIRSSTRRARAGGRG